MTLRQLFKRTYAIKILIILIIVPIGFYTKFYSDLYKNGLVTH